MAPKSSSSFRFEPRRARLDWRLLAAVDAERIARETDIDALERALDTVSFGDIAVEDPRHLSGARLRVTHAGHAAHCLRRAPRRGGPRARVITRRCALIPASRLTDAPRRRRRRAVDGEALSPGADDDRVPAARAGASPAALRTRAEALHGHCSGPRRACARATATPLTLARAALRHAQETLAGHKAELQQAALEAVKSAEARARPIPAPHLKGRRKRCGPRARGAGPAARRARIAPARGAQAPSCSAS